PVKWIRADTGLDPMKWLFLHHGPSRVLQFHPAPNRTFPAVQRQVYRPASPLRSRARVVEGRTISQRTGHAHRATRRDRNGGITISTGQFWGIAPWQHEGV